MFQQKLKLLLVDPNIPDRELIKSYLNHGDQFIYDIAEVESGVIALELIQSIKPDLILLNDSLSDLSGMQFIQKLNGDVEEKGLPIIVLADQENPNSAIDLMKAGVLDYALKKALNKTRLLRIMQQAVDRLELIRRLNLQKILVERNNRRLRRANQQLLLEIKERKRVEDILEHRAFHDTLTDLPNRDMFITSLDQSLKKQQNDDERLMALFCLDLNRFHYINESLGYDTGDFFLLEIAVRIQKFAGPNALISRTGDDKFLIYTDSVESDITTIANHLQKIVSQPVKIGAREIYSSANIGAVLFSHFEIPAESLVRDADSSLYYAKKTNRTYYEVHDASINREITRQFEFETSLRQALVRDEFEVHYQPIISLPNEIPTSMEALVRWRHPEKGLIPPDQFIPLAEESGLIVQIGELIARKACEQNVAWQKAGLPPLKIALNISAMQFKQIRFLEFIRELLRESTLEARFLDLEITESMVMGNEEHTIVTLQETKKMGVNISIDDFGTGYSSLSYLKRFPIDTLKIDRSFIKELPVDHGNIEIVKAIVGLARGLNLDLVAEGVENGEQLNFLYNEGVRRIQGYYFSQPLEAKEVPAFINRYMPPIGETRSLPAAGAAGLNN